MICHLDIASIALHKDSEEAKQQIQREEGIFEGKFMFQFFSLLRLSFVTIPDNFYLDK